VPVFAVLLNQKAIEIAEGFGRFDISIGP